MREMTTQLVDFFTRDLGAAVDIHNLGKENEVIKLHTIVLITYTHLIHVSRECRNIFDFIQEIVKKLFASQLFLTKNSDICICAIKLLTEMISTQLSTNDLNLKRKIKSFWRVLLPSIAFQFDFVQMQFKSNVFVLSEIGCLFEKLDLLR